VYNNIILYINSWGDDTTTTTTDLAQFLLKGLYYTIRFLLKTLLTLLLIVLLIVLSLLYVFCVVEKITRRRTTGNFNSVTVSNVY